MDSTLLFLLIFVFMIFLSVLFVIHSFWAISLKNIHRVVKTHEYQKELILSKIKQPVKNDVPLFFALMPQTMAFYMVGHALEDKNFYLSFIDHSNDEEYRITAQHDNYNINNKYLIKIIEKEITEYRKWWQIPWFLNLLAGNSSIKTVYIETIKKASFA